jgi:hypothetical protein
MNKIKNKIKKMTAFRTADRPRRHPERVPYNSREHEVKVTLLEDNKRRRLAK